MLSTTTAQFKFVLVGDSAVGKSSLLNRFVDRTFSQSLLSTIGVDFKFRKVKINGQDIKLQIWDTAGQQTFRSIVSAYYSSADAIVIVYDITSFESFESVKDYWIQQAQNNNKNNAKIFIIGNKIDQSQKKQVEQYSIQNFMEVHKIEKSYQVSAKDGTNVQDCFTDITKILYLGPQAAKVKTKNNSTIKDNQKKGQKKAQIQKSNIQSQEKAPIKLSKPQNEQSSNTNGFQKARNPNYNQNCCLK